MLTRSELVDRVEARLRARGQDDALEASMCFLRAILAGVDDDAPVSEALLAQVARFLKIDLGELMLDGKRSSTRPPIHWSAPTITGAQRLRRILFLGRADAARPAMLEAVGRALLEDSAEVRSASISPVALDARAMKALRHAGYPTEPLSMRALSVDDLSWADVVVTCGGEREDWDRFIPRSIAHEHQLIDDPVQLARTLAPDDDDQNLFRSALRGVERAVAAMRPVRNAPLVPRRPVSVRSPQRRDEPKK